MAAVGAGLSWRWPLATRLVSLNDRGGQRLSSLLGLTWPPETPGSSLFASGGVWGQPTELVTTNWTWKNNSWFGSRTVMEVCRLMVRMSSLLVLVSTL